MTRTALTLAASAFAFSAAAGTTPIFESDEPNHLEILNSIFQEDFGATTNVFGASARGGSSTDFVALLADQSEINILRVDDFGGENRVDMNGTQFGTEGPRPSFDDDVWTNGIANLEARARHALNTQEFGYYTGSGEEGNDQFVSLFDTSGNGEDVSGSASFNSATDTNGTNEWRWGRRGAGFEFSSLASDNADGIDHMVTYFFEYEGVVNWLIFWEDLPEGNAMADFDYNDLVVQITVVPMPTAGLMALAGLGGIATIRRR